MIKKILKLTVAVMTLGLFTTSVFAAEWGASGQVRVDWDITKTIEDADKRDDADLPGGKRIPNGIYIDLDDSWVTLKLSGDDGAFGSITYYPSGAIYYDGGGSVESGEWTATAVVNARDIQGQTGQVGSARAGNSDLGDRVGNHSVKIAHSSGFSVTAGRITPLDTWRKGQGYTLMGETGGAPHVADVASGANTDALDNRSSVVDIGILNSDALTLGVVIEQSDSGASNLGSAFGSIGYGASKNIDTDITPQDLVTAASEAGATARDATTVARANYKAGYEAAFGDPAILKGAPSTNIGFKVGVAAGPLSLGAVLISAGEAGDKSLGGNPKYKASASAIGLGVGLNLGAITPYLNLWMPSSKSENQFTVDETKTTATNIGVDYKLNETSGVSLSIVNRTSTLETQSYPSEATATLTGTTLVVISAPVTVKGETKVSSFEIGYKTVFGGANFYLGYVSSTISSDPDTATAGEDGDVKVSWLKARLQMGF